MLMNYIIIKNKIESYYEINLDKELLNQIIIDYKKDVRRVSVKGLIRYILKLGYRVNEMISIDKDEAEEIVQL